MKKRIFAYAKTKTQISCAVTAKLISAFVFATWIVQSLYFLNSNFQASIHLQWLCSPFRGGPGRKPRRPVFSRRDSNMLQGRRGLHKNNKDKPDFQFWLLSTFSVFLCNILSLSRFIPKRTKVVDAADHIDITNHFCPK